MSISLTAVHSYVPALCLEIDEISRYSSSDARSPVKGHTHTKFRVMLHVNSCGLNCHLNTLGHCLASRKQDRRKVPILIIF